MTEGVQVVESMLGREVLHRVYEEEEPGKQLLVPRIGRGAWGTHGTLQA
jgi:hypothetical protein